MMPFLFLTVPSHLPLFPIPACASAAAQPLSVVSINGATARVDGACLMEDWLAARPLSYRGEHLASEWRPVRAIFSELHERFTAALDVAPRERGHTLRVLYFSGVHPDARRDGVIQGLWTAAVDVARANGYTSITAQASSEATRKMLRDELGFAEVAAVPFADFRAAAEEGGYSGAVFAELTRRSPDARLSIHRRSIPSDLY
jgi:hypothetical protein